MAAEGPAELPEDGLFNELRLANFRGALIRNIVSLRVSEYLFDDLSDRPQDWKLAQQVEDAVKPQPYQSAQPVIDRPFEEAVWFHAVGFPFNTWSGSRYSDGSFGVWYGSDTVETGVWESAWHWYFGFLADAGFQQEGVSCERKLYQVDCRAALLDFRGLCRRYPALVHPGDYSFTQAVGQRIHREGHPGLVTQSVRFPQGECFGIFNPAVLSRPRQHGALSYRVQGGQNEVEARKGEILYTLPLAELA